MLAKQGVQPDTQLHATRLRLRESSGSTAAWEGLPPNTEGRKPGMAPHLENSEGYEREAWLEEGKASNIPATVNVW